MRKVINCLMDAMEEVQDERAVYKPMATGFDVARCEECGFKALRLILTSEGFFHCDPCHFMYVRKVAVQEAF